MSLNIKKEFGNNRSRKPDMSTLVYGKVPPQNQEMEQSVLSAIMGETHIIDSIVNIIPSADCFYVDAHQKIYKAILELYNKNSPVDPFSVMEQLRKANELEIVGGTHYVMGLHGNMINTAIAESHARVVMEKFIAREVIRISGQAISDGYDDSIDVFDLLNSATTSMEAILSQSITRKPKHIRAIVAAAMKEINEQQAANVEFTGVPTGFKKLDALTGGWQRGELIIIAARPSVGKTAFCLNLADYAASNIYRPTPTAIFSLEMKDKSLVKRMLSFSGRVHAENIKHPKRLTEGDVIQLAAAAETLSKRPIFIDETPGLSMQEFKAKSRKLAKEQGVGLIIIDYLQLMRCDTKVKENREQEVSKISRDTKQLAKELDIPIIALSQLNRGMEQGDRAPRLSDLRESGAIEQDADVVAFLYNPTVKMLTESPGLFNGKVALSIEKQRDGSTGDILLQFEKEYQKFTCGEFSAFTDKPQEPQVNHHNTMRAAAARNVLPPERDDSETDKEKLPF